MKEGRKEERERGKEGKYVKGEINKARLKKLIWRDHLEFDKTIIFF